MCENILRFSVLVRRVKEVERVCGGRTKDSRDEDRTEEFYRRGQFFITSMIQERSQFHGYTEPTGQNNQYSKVFKSFDLKSIK